MSINLESTTPTSRLRPDTLAASVTILLVANIVQRSIGFGRGILFCRWLSPDELGTWEMAYSFLLLGSAGRRARACRGRSADIWNVTASAGSSARFCGGRRSGRLC